MHSDFEGEDVSARKTKIKPSLKRVEETRETELFVLRSSQRFSFKEEIKCLKDSTPLPCKSPLIQLNPFLDKGGILRVGGRLSKSPLPINQKTPIIIDRKSNAAVLLVRRFHEKVQHQEECSQKAPYDFMVFEL